MSTFYYVLVAAPASWRVPSCNPSSCLWLDLEFNPRKGASSIAAAGHHKLTSVEAATSIAPSDDDWDTRIPVAYLQFAFSFIARSAKTGKMSRWLRICTRRVVVGLTTLDVVAGVRRDACFGMLAHKVISDFRQARSLRPVAASDLQCRNLDFSGWMVAARVSLALHPLTLIRSQWTRLFIDTLCLCVHSCVCHTTDSHFDNGCTSSRGLVWLQWRLIFKLGVRGRAPDAVPLRVVAMKLNALRRSLCMLFQPRLELP